MNIKTAFRYQNFLNTVISSARYKLSLVKIRMTETHQRSLANTDAVDEVIETENPDLAAGITAEKCIALLFDLFNEKSALDKAIAEAKKASDFDFDAELNSNKARRELISFLSPYASCTNGEKMSRGSDYKFNAEGNQVSYSYPVKVVSELTYDPGTLSEKIKALDTIADDISDKVDKFLLETEFDFTPAFDIHDKFDDIIKRYNTET